MIAYGFESLFYFVISCGLGIVTCTLSFLIYVEESNVYILLSVAMGTKTVPEYLIGLKINVHSPLYL